MSINLDLTLDMHNYYDPFRIGIAMKKSSALQRCAGNCGGGRECATEITFNKGRKAVIRMLGKRNKILNHIFENGYAKQNSLDNLKTQIVLKCYISRKGKFLQF